MTETAKFAGWIQLGLDSSTKSSTGHTWRVEARDPFGGVSSRALPSAASGPLHSAAMEGKPGQIGGASARRRFVGLEGGLQRL